MNKRITAVIISAAAILSGCLPNNTGKTENESADKNIVKHEISADENYLTDEGAIEICAYDRDKIYDVINACGNLSASDDIIINIPERAPVLEFTKSEPVIPTWEQDFEEYYNDFTGCFEYFFPGHELNEEYLYYFGEDSYEKYDGAELIRKLGNVKDDKEKLLKNEGGSVQFEYDEGRYGKDKGIVFTMGPDISYFIGIVDKNKIDPDGLDTKDGILLPPDSEKSFMLGDGELPVREAVSFFEEYVNGAPCKDPDFETRVAAVLAIPTDDTHYCYYFYTTVCCNGICFESGYGSIGSFSHTTDYYVMYTNIGIMTESSEIDHISGITRRQIMEDISRYDGVISFDEAVKTISSKLTDQVVFEVRLAEFVYACVPITTEEGYIDINGYPMSVKPVWKLTLYNPNDNNTYLCYVSADSGEFEYSVRLG